MILFVGCLIVHSFCRYHCCFVNPLVFEGLGMGLPGIRVDSPLEGRKDLMLQPFQFAKLAANYIDPTPLTRGF